MADDIRQQVTAQAIQAAMAARLLINVSDCAVNNALTAMAEALIKGKGGK